VQGEGGLRFAQLPHGLGGQPDVDLGQPAVAPGVGEQFVGGPTARPRQCLERDDATGVQAVQRLVSEADSDLQRHKRIFAGGGAKQNTCQLMFIVQAPGLPRTA